MLFQNSYSANRGKRDIVEEEEIEDEELTDDEYDELMGRYFNPNGFFFQPGKRSNPNSKSKGPYLKYIFMFLAFLGLNHLGTSLMADLCQDINRVSSISRCPHGTFP